MTSTQLTVVQSWGFLSLKTSLFGCTAAKYRTHFPAHAASILFLSIFRRKIGVLKYPALFQGRVLDSLCCSKIIEKIVSQQQISVTQFKFENYSNQKTTSTEDIETTNSSPFQDFCHHDDLTSSIFDSTN